MRKKRILHLSADYPNPHRNRTTTAVEWLVQGLVDFDNVVISMKRTIWPHKTFIRDCGTSNGSKLYAFSYFGLPFGVGHYLSAFVASRTIRREMVRINYRPDVIHGHKFACEGLMGLFLKKNFDAKLAVSVRGESDIKFLRVYPFYRLIYKSIIENCDALFFVSAWMRPRFHQLFGRHHNEWLLPNIVRSGLQEGEPYTPTMGFVTIFDLNVWEKKGFRVMLDALRMQVSTKSTLDVIGSGKPETSKMLAQLVNEYGLSDRVNFIGRVDNNDIPTLLKRYNCFVLPSMNETFGMSYVEALFAGLPVIYCADTGIDGYLDYLDVGIRVRQNSAADLARALNELQVNGQIYRERVENSREKLWGTFSRDNILSTYNNAVS